MHFTLGAADSRRKQIHKFADDVARAVGVVSRAVVLGVKLKNIVNHCKAKTAHDFNIKPQIGIVQTLLDTADVVEKTLGVIVGKRNHRVCIKADRAADAVIIGRQQSLQKTVWGSKPLKLRAFHHCNILDFARRWHNHKAVFYKVEAPFIIHKTALALQAYQMQATIGKALGVDAVNI